MDIGTLTIQMAANVARIQQDMDAAKKIVGGAMHDVEGYVEKAKSAFVALGGAVTVEGFVELVHGIVEAKARLVELSSSTGMSVESLGALKKTAQLAGTSLEDVAAASAKLSKGVETGTTGTVRAIEALGLNFQKFKQLAPEEQMQAVATAMDGFADGTGKTAAAMELFGRSGAQMLPFLKEMARNTNQTTVETREAAERAKEFEDNLKKLKQAGDEWKSMVVDKMTPALAEFTRQMVESKTWSERLAAIWGNIKSNFGFDELGKAKTNAEAYSAEIERVTNVMIGLRNVLDRDPGNANAQRRYDNLAATLRKLQADAAKANEALKATADNTDGRDNFDSRHYPPKPKVTGLDAHTGPDQYTPLIKSITEHTASLQTEFDAVEKSTDAQKMAAKVMADIRDGYLQLTVDQKRSVTTHLEELLAVDKLNTAKEKEAKWLEESRKETEAALAAQQKKVEADAQQVKQADDAIEAFGKTREELEAMSSARDRESAASLRQRASMLDTEGELGILRDLYLQQANALDTLAARKDQLAAKEAREANDATAGASRAVREYLDEVKRAGDSTARLVSSSISSLEDGISGLAIGKKFDVHAWVDQIIQEMFRLAVVKPLLAEIFGAGGASSGGGWIGTIGNIVGSLAGMAGGSLTVDTGGMGTNLTGGALPTAGGKAGGGDVRAGQTYTVGEHGPELLHMGDSNGAITPNGGASRPVTVNVVNNGAAVSAKSQTRETPQGTIVDLILDTVAHDVAAGGRVADAHARRFGANGAAGVPRY